MTIWPPGSPPPLEVAAAANVLTADGSEPLDFTIKAHRVLAEHAALLATAIDPAAELLNLSAGHRSVLRSAVDATGDRKLLRA